MMQRTVTMGYGLTLGCAEAQQLLDMVTATRSALPPAMTWTRERPTVPGWYWLKREQEDVRVVQVISAGSGNLFACYADVEGDYVHSVYIDDPQFIWDWAGPMEPPQ